MQTDFFIAFILFIATYSAIIVSNVKKSGFPIWLIMNIGASIMVLFGIVSVEEAYSSINLRVISSSTNNFTSCFKFSHVIC